MWEAAGSGTGRHTSNCPFVSSYTKMGMNSLLPTWTLKEYLYPKTSSWECAVLALLTPSVSYSSQCLRQPNCIAIYVHQQIVLKRRPIFFRQKDENSIRNAILFIGCYLYLKNSEIATHTTFTAAAANFKKSRVKTKTFWSILASRRNSKTF